MRSRRVLLAVGTVITGVGLVMTALPGVAAVVPGQQELVLVVAVVAVGGALVTLSRRRGVDFERVETGDPETLVSLQAPGDEARSSFRRASALKLTDSRHRVEERLRKVAVDVIRRRHDCSAAEAEEMLATGEWTDDPHAAAFLGDGEAVDTPRLPPGMWLRVESPFTYRARRTVDAIVALSGMEVEA
jgi:hypothetical protein